MSTEDKKEIAEMVIADLFVKGYVVVRATDLEAIEQKKREASLMRKKALTPHAIVKHGLIPGIKSAKTIKNMCKDGRFSRNEFFKDNKGILMVLTSAVKRERGYE